MHDGKTHMDALEILREVVKNNCGCCDLHKARKLIADEDAELKQNEADYLAQFSPLSKETRLESVKDLLTVRAFTAAKNSGIKVLGDFAKYSEAEWLKHKNFGVNALKSVKQVCAEAGVRLPSETQWNRRGA